MKIGITECGDAGLDFSWYEKLQNNSFDGCILISKNINDNFIDKVLDLYNNSFDKIIIHCTCTGWGSSYLEPNVPEYIWQLEQLQKIINMGFPKEQCVLRIDPIIPTTEGLKRVENVLDAAFTLGLLPDMRIRISVLDEYKHVKERLSNINKGPFYDSSFYAPKQMIKALIDTLQRYNLVFECCAEPYLNNNELFLQTGCISNNDLNIFKLEITKQNINPQNRKGCCCLSCKTELLNCKKRCPHQCLYCYWKD